MIQLPQMVLDPRDAAAFLAELLARIPGYVPEWKPEDGDPGRALAAIVAKYSGSIVERLNQAPAKQKLAFLDMLGIGLGPARASRAPIVFELAKGAASGTARAATGVAAPPAPGTSQPLAFETESDCGIMAGKLAQVFSLIPERDEYVDHTADLAAGKAFTIFDPNRRQPLPHHLYLQHSTLLNLSGNVELDIEFQFPQQASERLVMLWEYWDGKVWRGFLSLDPQCFRQAEQSDDGTAGFQTSGVVILKADCAKSDVVAVNNVKGYWIRTRLVQPLPPGAVAALPVIDSIRISSIVKQLLSAKLSSSALTQLNIDLIRKRFLTLGLPLTPVPAVSLGGQVVNDAGQPIGSATVTITDPNEPGFGSHSSLPSDANGEFEVLLPDFASTRTLLVEVAFKDIVASTDVDIAHGNWTAVLTVSVSGIAPDQALNDATALDVTKPFYPFGQQPQPGTTFYFASAEIFSKPGARFRIYLPRTTAPSDAARPVANDAGVTKNTICPLDHLVNWEYWDGNDWIVLAQSKPGSPGFDFTTTEVLDFEVPRDMVPAVVNGAPLLAMRARLVSGGFGFVQQVTFQTGNDHPAFNIVVTQPPVIAAMALGYTWQYGPSHPENVLTFNDFKYADHTDDAIWPGTSFEPFAFTKDQTAAVYLGFDQPPPEDSIGLYLDIVEDAMDEDGPALVWEYFNGSEWPRLSVEDETANLRLPGIATFLGEDDNVPLARFGTPLSWVRARLKEDGPPGQAVVNAIYPNAVWASQLRTYQNTILGAARGVPNEVFTINQVPVIEGERIEIRESNGQRANVEWRILALELASGDASVVRQLEVMLAREGPQTDIQLGDIRLRRDKQKRVTEVWVHWYAHENLFLSGPQDRHYAMDHSRGLVFFGDGVNGRMLPLNSQVMARTFRSGGGTQGNVAARTITQLLGSVPGVASVYNPAPAEGGSDRETVEEYARRAPGTVRHRGRALAEGDYEVMAREASSAVRIVKAIANRNPAGRTVPGWITVLIIPESQDPQPWPSHGLREEVRLYLTERAPAGLAAGGRIFVTGPQYVPVGVTATIVPVDFNQAGVVEKAARAAIETFLDPLHGGQTGAGLEFGRAVYRSDLAAVLEDLDGLDHVESLLFEVNGQPAGDTVAIDPDRIAAAGPVQLKVKAAAR
jgi:uncharacterized phage protein gp47/JayE